MIIQDTHTIIKDLMTEGMSEKLAEKLTSIFLTPQQLSTFEKEQVNLATKADLDKLKLEIKLEIRDSKISLLFWILPFLLTIIGLIFYIK